MAKKLKPDRFLFLVTLALVGFGVAMVFSSSAIVAKEKFGDPNYFAFKQLISATLGLAVMFIIMKVDYHFYRQPAIVFSMLALVVALLVLVFFLASSGEHAPLDSIARLFRSAFRAGEARAHIFSGVLPREAQRQSE